MAAPFLASIFPFTVAAQNASNAQIVRLARVEGTVEVQRPGQPTPQPAQANLPLEQGSSLVTGKGTASIEWPSGATGFVADNSVLEFTQLAATPNASITRLTMREGAARFYSNVGSADTFAVLTPDVSVFPQQSGDFRVEVNRNSTVVTVLNGQALVGSLGANWTVVKGRTLIMTHGELQPAIVATPSLTRYAYGTGTSLDALLRGTVGQKLFVLSAPPPSANAANSSSSSQPDHAWWAVNPNNGPGTLPLGQGAQQLPFQNGVWVLAPGTDTSGARQSWPGVPYQAGQWLYSPQGWMLVPNNPSASPGN